ncbi:MAG: OmpA/MotB family protein [Candidatus Scalindua sp.]
MTIATVRKKRKKIPAEDGMFVDMVAFASLMTILLAFFIMLSCYAGRPKEEVAEEALKSFKEALDNYGISKIIFGNTDSIFNLNFTLETYGGKYKKKKPTDKNVFVNTIDKDSDVEYIKAGHRVDFPTEINFINEELAISPESKQYLNNLIKVIKNRNCKVIVGGYTSDDFVSSDRYPTSWQLSAEYASAVTKYFNNVGNIDYKRLTAVGYGGYQPLLGEASSFNTRANNRINITIVYN